MLVDVLFQFPTRIELIELVITRTVRNACSPEIWFIYLFKSFILYVGSESEVRLLR